ncbi:Nudix family hydrolase [Alkalilimnicola ehrlichii]|uniref:Nudix family hydrolase n=1 Tax=Alkalilimnicola ehrlichii TaxID=351052 RepID=UPI0026848710|nr:Nudix family hydrolase [Alkalilimnicola ehrlichii]
MSAKYESKPLHVAVAAVFDAAGRVLLARRPKHVHQGDLWEFPGGKVEAGESVEAALARELWEEVHIRPLRSRPLIQIPFRYPDRYVLLDVWRVEAFAGEPEGREGQPLAWVEPDSLGAYRFPAANRPIVSAVQLPPVYAISGSVGTEVERFLTTLEQTLDSGVSLLQLRLGLPEDSPAFAEIAKRAIGRARSRGARVLLNAAPQRARQLGADGVHLSSARLRALGERPLPDAYWVAASCHCATELAQAARIGADFAVLSPVCETPSHPGARLLGWEGFRELTAEAALPVYALGVSTRLPWSVSTVPAGKGSLVFVPSGKYPSNRPYEPGAGNYSLAEG